MNRRPPAPLSQMPLNPVDREHYQVAREFEGFFEEAEFRDRYLRLFPRRPARAIRPDRYAFNQTPVRRSRGIPFLWWDGAESYVFVGLNGAPKGFRAPGEILGSGATPPSETNTTAASGSASRLELHVERAREVAQKLYTCFLPGGPGIYGEHNASQDIMPQGIARGSRDHLLFLTLTNCLNRTRIALDLWRQASDAWSDPKTHWLFEPDAICKAGRDAVKQELHRLKLSKKINVDAEAWFRIAWVLEDRWGGDPRNLLVKFDYNAPAILSHIKTDGTLVNGKMHWSFLLLRGNKIAPLWIRMLRDCAGIGLKGLEDVPIATDVHVLRATFCSGAITGRFTGPDRRAFESIRAVWREATRDLKRADGLPMVPLDIDEALWTLGARGCAQRGSGTLKHCPAECPLAGTCAEGRIRIQKGQCEIDVE